MKRLVQVSDSHCIHSKISYRFIYSFTRWSFRTHPIVVHPIPTKVPKRIAQSIDNERYRCILLLPSIQ